MLSDGEFHSSIWKDGIEVWVTQMGPLMNMNTAFIDRSNGVVAIIDPYDAEQWREIGARRLGGYSLTIHTYSQRSCSRLPWMMSIYPDLRYGVMKMQGS